MYTMTLVPIIFTFIAIIIFIPICISYGQLRAKAKLLSQDLSLTTQEHSELTNEKIKNIKEIERLSAKVEYQEKIISEFKELRKNSEESTRSALFNLGNDLSKQLIELHKKENKETRDLSEQNIKKTSEQFNQEFERLVKMVSALSKDIDESKDAVDIIKTSLLSPSGAGSLAEITLENILKASHLRSGIDFKMQYSTFGEEQNLLRPDALIFLPSDNIMIIDAKASKFLLESDDNLNQLSRTMNTHIKSLSSKDYAEYILQNFAQKASNNSAKRLVGNVITLMFLPTEHAIEKILEADSEFMNKAWKQNIFPVGPAGLMNMLSFAKFQISEHLMLNNHQIIIEEVRKLIASISSLAEHSGRLSNNIRSLVGNYDKFAASFNSNFLNKAKNIGKYGINIDIKKLDQNLMRYQLISSKSAMIEVEEGDRGEDQMDREKQINKIET